MKKIIPILFVFFLLYSFITNDEVIIPNDAIRFRIIANSNTLKDQELKMKVKNEIDPIITQIMENSQTKEESKKLILENIENIRKKVQELNPNSKVNYGQNYFPEKEYNGIKYSEGKYESLVITLGSGEGNNWWCVMFPPLCLIDNEKIKNEDVEYKLLVKELLNKY